MYVLCKVLSCSTTCSTTWSGMLHYMAGNDYRSGRRQVSLVVDEGLWLAVRESARLRGCSVSALVRDALASEIAGDVVEVEPVRSGRDVLAGIVAAGLVREGRASVALDRDETYTVGVYSVDSDPLEGIA